MQGLYFDSHQWQMYFNSHNQYITHIAQDYFFKDKAKLKLSFLFSCPQSNHKVIIHSSEFYAHLNMYNF